MIFESKIFGRLYQKTNMIVYMVLIVRKEEVKFLLALNSQISHTSPLMGVIELHNGHSQYLFFG